MQRNEIKFKLDNSNLIKFKNETLAIELNFKEDLTNAQELEFDDIKIKIKIFKN